MTDPSSESGFTWRSQPVFVIVAVGATLSLNDFLTFPVMAGQNGGAEYSYVDSGWSSGPSYSYLLEVLHADGSISQVPLGTVETTLKIYLPVIIK